MVLRGIKMKRIKKSSFWMGDRYFCGYCEQRLSYLDDFCSHCGRAVEWERCPYCKHIIETMSGDFCRDCGTAPIRR